MTRRITAASVLAVAASTVVLAAFAAALSWHLHGGRWYMVQTPSMGRAAPVGTLLLTTPVSVAQVRVGDIIAFHPPQSTLTYSHRVIRNQGGRLRTKGDVNPTADAWTLTQANIIGKVTHRWWAVGWVLRALPLLLVCLAVVALVVMFFPPAWRSPLRLVGAGLSVAVTGAVLRPWVAIERLGATNSASGPVVRVISTGILPIRASAQNGSGSAHLVNGQAASILITRASRDGAYRITTHLDLNWWWRLGIVAICLAPLLWTLVIGLAPLPPAPPGEPPVDPADPPETEPDSPSDAGWLLDLDGPDDDPANEPPPPGGAGRLTHAPMP